MIRKIIDAITPVKTQKTESPKTAEVEICAECGQPVIDYTKQLHDMDAEWRGYRRMPGRFGEGNFELIRDVVRENNLIRNDATAGMLHGVEMHIANALTLLKELASATSATAIEARSELQSDARIKGEKNLIKILFHLQFATDCASGFPALHAFLLKAERVFEAEGVFPDLSKFTALMKEARSALAG